MRSEWPQEAHPLLGVMPSPPFIYFACRFNLTLRLDLSRSVWPYQRYVKSERAGRYPVTWATEKEGGVSATVVIEADFQNRQKRGGYTNFEMSLKPHIPTPIGGWG